MKTTKNTPFPEHPKKPEHIRREDINQAIREYQERGGQIKKIETFWIEENQPPGYHSRH